MRPAPPTAAVWAPYVDSVRLAFGDEVSAMRRAPDGWWYPTVELPGTDVDYGYLVDDDDQVLPDPRSRRQPEGVHGRSRTFDATDFRWTDQTWAGRELEGSLLYELHVGTFTPEGTFDGVVSRLDHLLSLGVGFVEVMPVNAFNGVRNWGYDGVLWSAIHEPYGGPAGYQRLVDACHAVGIGVVQDVVYNHLGPSGNYLPRFAPYLKSEGANTWGSLLNLDGPDSAEVRRLIIDNALMWFADFHVDGLRLDAVHALQDSSDPHLLAELSAEVDELATEVGRPLTLIAESDLNDARMVQPVAGGGYGMDAQWNDDFHHGLHVALTGETSGYYADFEDVSALAKVYNRGFFHDGTYSSFRDQDHGAPVDVEHLAAWRFVVYSQNHDQIGNRARGDRLTDHLDDGMLLVAALLTFTAPFTPMLFQGEEWAASTPFQFFTSHPEPELGEATASGRFAEFARMGWDPADVPHPQAESTFTDSRLDWSEPDAGRHARILAAYRELAGLRASLPELRAPTFGGAEADDERRTLLIRRGRLLVAVNFGSDAARFAVDQGEILFRAGEGQVLDADGLVLPPGTGALVARA
ncbi:MAG: maltooligosyl trehalose hydrolase [Marmoricola sp.]|nr:maltooligosyl trehalose hydrolase [Marmoricola sp.]